MLYLEPPFHVINGVSVFSDHADPLQKYFLPVAPNLTQIVDPVTAEAIPQLQLIKYRGTAGNGGFLNFDVNLGISDELINDIRRELRNREGLDDLPRLAPVPLVDGSVRLMLLGKQSGDGAGGTAAPGAPQFVVKMDHAAKPALYGDNQAAFSVQLDQAGVTVVEQALQGEMAPMGIVYSLDFWALRPAYSVHVSADWDRVQTHFEESFNINLFITSLQIDEIVDKLIEDQVILVEVDTFVPEGEDTADIVGRRDQAINDVKDMVLRTFFQPTLQPMDFTDDPDGWDKFVDTVQSLHRIGTLGAAANDSVGYRRLDATRVDRRNLNVNYRERTAVKRTIYPQGHLTGLFRVLRDTSLTLDRFIMSVDLDDPWFERRRVRAISRANFAADGIQSLNVMLQYGNTPKNLILDAGKAEATAEWASILQNGEMRRDISARYKVTFADVDSAERPVVLESPPQTLSVENLEINPRELYSLSDIPIMALNFPWSKYTHVEVETRYDDPANAIALRDAFVLSEKAQETRWRMFVRDPQRTAFDYRLIYRAADHHDIEGEWQQTEAEQIIIRDPFPSKRTLEIMPAFNWNEVMMVFVDVTYADQANGILEEKSLSFNRDEALPKTFSVDLVNPEQRLLTYQATVVFIDGRVRQLPPADTLERRAIIRDDMKGHTIIRTRPEQVDFAARKVTELDLDLRYVDEMAGLSFADRATFNSPNDQFNFEFDFVNENKTQYEYRVTYRFTNGLARTTEWAKSNNKTLLVPVG